MSGKWVLVGSTGRGLDDLADMIRQRMYWQTVVFTPSGSDVWDVASGKGSTSYRVVFKKGRHRLERPA